MLILSFFILFYNWFIIYSQYALLWRIHGEREREREFAFLYIYMHVRMVERAPNYVCGVGVCMCLLNLY